MGLHRTPRRRGDGRSTGLRVLALLLVIGLAALACGTGLVGGDELETVPEPGDADLGGLRVLVLGDSLTMSAEREMRDLAFRHGYRLRVSAASGHTPCDGLPALEAALGDRPPDLVILAYAGNSWLYSTCQGEPGQSEADAVERYREVLGAMIDDVATTDGLVGLVGGPVWPANTLAPAVFDAVRGLAEDRAVAFTDGGRWVTPGRRWRETVPCRPAEPGCEDGQVRVHLSSGTESRDVHFDCDAPGWQVALDLPCPVYSAGGHRWARAIDELVLELAGTASAPTG